MSLDEIVEGTVRESRYNYEASRGSRSRSACLRPLRPTKQHLRGACARNYCLSIVPSATKLVPQIARFLRYLGATEVDVPKETVWPGLGKQICWEAKEFAADRLVVDLIRIKFPGFTAVASNQWLNRGCLPKQKSADSDLTQKMYRTRYALVERHWHLNIEHLSTLTCSRGAANRLRPWQVVLPRLTILAHKISTIPPLASVQLKCALFARIRCTFHWQSARGANVFCVAASIVLVLGTSTRVAIRTHTARVARIPTTE